MSKCEHMTDERLDIFVCGVAWQLRLSLAAVNTWLVSGSQWTYIDISVIIRDIIVSHEWVCCDQISRIQFQATPSFEYDLSANRLHFSKQYN